MMAEEMKRTVDGLLSSRKARRKDIQEMKGMVSLMLRGYRQDRGTARQARGATRQALLKELEETTSTLAKLYRNRLAQGSALRSRLHRHTRNQRALVRRGLSHRKLRQEVGQARDAIKADLAQAKTEWLRTGPEASAKREAAHQVEASSGALLGKGMSRPGAALTKDSKKKDKAGRS